MPKVISHLYYDKDTRNWQIQTNEEHCQGVADLAAGFASEFGMESWGRMLGLLHDRGKESEGFQAHIKRTSGYDESASSPMPHFHSMTGARIAHTIQKLDDLYWLSNCIAGHHRGLYDIADLEKEIKGEMPQGIDTRIPPVPLQIPSRLRSLSESCHLTRMLFSCLVDADWLDTERFMSPERHSARQDFASIADLKKSLDLYLKGLHGNSSGELNRIRTEIQDICANVAAEAPGFFTLTVPTGGGKTIASVVWALNHAIRHNKKRIIIAIPFTSIIVQTAAKLKEIFGKENVIEHHSALNETGLDKKSLLACENWDAPIIVTTNVQLFESVFSNRPASCRKLHSLCNSVVVLDEVQSLPLTFLQPIVDSMKAYANLFGTSFLFTTATQPILAGKYRGCADKWFKGFEEKEVKEIVPASMNLHDRLRRVKIDFLNDPLSYEGIGKRISEFDKVLCVVNTRKHAMEIFHSLIPRSDTNDYHLSRYMCGAHILKTIDKIKEELKSGRKGVRVVATQLIEAGVDIDFPVVFRQICGLDSILQAAGRCNREGKLECGNAYVFSLEKERNMGSIAFATDVMKDLVSISPDMDCFSPSTIKTYYKKLYTRTPDFDKENIGEKQKHPLSTQFEEIEERFRLINEDGINIIINFEDSESLVNQLKEEGPSRKLSRELGKYSVNVPRSLFKKLAAGGLIEEPYKGFYYIPFREQYDDQTGLKVDNDFLEQTFII